MKQILTFEEYRVQFIALIVSKGLITLEEANKMFGGDEMLDAYDYGTSLEDAVSSLEYFGVE